MRKEQGKERSEKRQNKNKKQERDTQKKQSLEERSTRRVLRREREREDIKDVRCGAEEGNPGGVQVCNIRDNTHCHDVYVR